MDNTQGLTATQKRLLDFPQVTKLGLENPPGLSGSLLKPCNSGHAASWLQELLGGSAPPSSPQQEKREGKKQVMGV